MEASQHAIAPGWDGVSLITEKFDGTQFNEFDYIEDSVTVDTGLFRVQTVPTAKIETDATVDFTANQRVRISDPNNNTFFEGVTKSAGSYAENGRKTITVENSAKQFVEETISYDRTTQSAEDHLKEIRDEANIFFTITYNATANATFEYGPDEKLARRAIQDVLDAAGVVAYFTMDPGELIINDRNTGGQYRDVSTEQDPIRIQQWEEGTVDSVRNAVVVIPSGGLGLVDAASASDSASISEYGRRGATYNVNSIYTQSAAQEFADSLLQPNPLATGQIQVAGGADFYQDLANQSIEVSDSTRDLNNQSLLISKQTIRPNRVTLGVGDAMAKTSVSVNRGTQSFKETNKAGTVITEDRVDKLDLDTTQVTIGNDTSSRFEFTIDSQGNTALTPQSASTSRIGSTTNPFGRVEADIIRAQSTLQANDDSGNLIFASSDLADTGIVLEYLSSNDDYFFRPSVGTATRNTRALIGDSTFYWDEMHAGNFITHSPDPDKPNPDLSKIVAYDWYNPPEYATRRENPDGSYRRENPSDNGVELSHMTNWLLETCKVQQERIDELEARIDTLEKHLSDSGGNSH